MKKSKLKKGKFQKWAHKRVKRMNLQLRRVPSIPINEALAGFNEPFLKHLALMNLVTAGFAYIATCHPGWLDKLAKPTSEDLAESEKALDDAIADDTEGTIQ